MTTRATALLLGLFLPCAALAQGLQLSCRLEPESAPVGARQEAVVSLANVGSQAVELPRLAFDRQLVSLEVQLADGPQAIYERIHPDPYTPRADWPRASLAPGEKWELRIGLPALVAGPVSVTAHLARPLAGHKGLLEHLSAAPAKGEVVRDAAGNDTVELRFITTHGPMRARLFPGLAPATCLHIAELILGGTAAEEGVLRPGFYDGLTFHRVRPDFMIQGGDPEGDGRGGPGWSMPGEQQAAPVPEQAKHLPGRLSMAKSQDKDSGGSQFFVCTGTPSYLDGVHTVFGELVKGQDVAHTISVVDTVEVPGGEKSRPLTPVIIKTLRVVPAKSAQ